MSMDMPLIPASVLQGSLGHTASSISTNVPVILVTTMLSAPTVSMDISVYVFLDLPVLIVRLTSMNVQVIPVTTMLLV